MSTTENADDIKRLNSSHQVLAKKFGDDSSEPFTIDDAKELWQQFRANTLLSLRNLNTMSQTVTSSSARLNEGFVNNNNSSSSPSPSGESDKAHNPFMTFFIHGENQRLNFAPNDDSRSLETALSKGDWSAPVLQSKDCERLAFACLDNGRISFQQLITLLERGQYERDFGEYSTYPLLDENNAMTALALKSFLPSIQNSLDRTWHIKLRETQVEKFRLLIATLPKSEQVFFRINVSSNQYAIKEPSLLLQMVTLGIIRMNVAQHGEILMTSTGVEDALALTLYGVEQYVRPVHCLGRLSPREILSGVRQGIRPAAITLANGAILKNIHQYSEPSHTATTAHDRYHSHVMLKIPSKHRKALLYMIDVLQAQLANMHVIENSKRSIEHKKNSLMTKEIWNLADAEFAPTVESISLFNTGSAHGTAEFCRLLQKPKTTGFLNSGLFDEENRLTPVGTLILLDMLKNKSIWRGFNISLKDMTTPFKEGLKLIQQLKRVDNGSFFQSTVQAQLLIIQLLQQTDTDEAIDIRYQVIKDFITRHGIDNICELKRDNNWVRLVINEAVVSELKSLTNTKEAILPTTLKPPSVVVGSKDALSFTALGAQPLSYSDKSTTQDHNIQNNASANTSICSCVIV